MSPKLLRLQPHPEGGHYRETFRDPRVDANGRSVSTAIFYMLAANEVSHLAPHRRGGDMALLRRAPVVLTMSPDGHEAASTISAQLLMVGKRRISLFRPGVGRQRDGRLEPGRRHSCARLHLRGL
jgi:predicted cupin superfamily sugar epimerase